MSEASSVERQQFSMGILNGKFVKIAKKRLLFCTTLQKSGGDICYDVPPYQKSGGDMSPPSPPLGTPVILII